MWDGTGRTVEIIIFYTPNDYSNSLGLTFSNFGLRLAASIPAQ